MAGQQLISQQELFAALRNVNPWWEQKPDPGLPPWRRIAFGELLSWVTKPPTNRAVLVSGARRVGKTTLMRQVVAELISQGIDPDRVLYATFDDPLLKLVGLPGLLSAWDEMRPALPGVEYLFLDEIQYTSDWQTWLKHQVDFSPHRRIAVSGSAIPLTTDSPESGVGRWHTIKLPTLSFSEYLQIRKTDPPALPTVRSLAKISDWKESQRSRVAVMAKPLVAHFHEYLLRGGFPETAQILNITLAQRLLREDIVDKVLKRDMTALFGTRHVLEMEKTFLYLCLHDGGILDKTAICNALQLTKPSVNNFLEQFEAAHLVYLLRPFGYGKEILKGKQKAYLADAAIPGSVLGKGTSLLTDSTRLGAAVETAFFKHVFTSYYSQSISFSYWRSKKDQQEIDIIADLGEDLVPFEVKYASKVEVSDLKGMRQFCEERSIKRAYAITRELSDFGPLKLPGTSTTVLKIPAILACLWLSQLKGQA